MGRGVVVALLVAALAIASVECQRGPFGFFGNFFRRPVNRPPPRPFQFQGAPSAPAAPAGGGRSVNGCPTSAPNHSFGNRNYVFSWLNGPKQTCGQFTGNQARNYCSAMGMRAVSLDDPNKAQHFINELNAARTTYFWTG